MVIKLALFRASNILRRRYMTLCVEFVVKIRF